MSRRDAVLRSALDRFVLHHTDQKILTLTGFDDCVRPESMSRSAVAVLRLLDNSLPICIIVRRVGPSSC